MNYRDLYVCICEDGIAKSKSILEASVSTLHSLQGRLSYFTVDFYSWYLGSNLAVHSHYIHLFLALGHQSGQLLNVKAHTAISAQLRRLEFSTLSSF